MNRQYNTIFSITLQHSYYSSGYSHDFDLVPSAATQEIMRRLRVKVFPNKRGVPQFKALQEAFSTGTALAPVPDDTSFYFYLILKNPDLVNFSTLPSMVNGGALYLENSTGTALHPAQDHVNTVNNIPSALIRPMIYDYSFTAPAGTVEVRITKGATPLTPISLTSGSTSYSTRLNLTDSGIGKYSVAHYQMPGNTLIPGLSHDIFVDNGAVAARPFGIVHIRKTSTISLNDFTVDLLSRRARWNYFLVIKNDSTNTYFVEDQQTGVGYTPIVFSNDTGSIVPGSEEEKTYDMLIAQNPDADVYLWRPASGILYGERGKQNIALVRNNGMTDATVFEHLATPAPNGPKPDVIIPVVMPEPLFP